MKLVHKFRLVPVDENVANVADIEGKMHNVLNDRRMSAESKGAIIEDLTAKKRNLQSTRKSRVFVLLSQNSLSFQNIGYQNELKLYGEKIPSCVQHQMMRL